MKAFLLDRWEEDGHYKFRVEAPHHDAVNFRIYDPSNHFVARYDLTRKQVRSLIWWLLKGLLCRK
jgi:hypothetical protein